MRIALVVHDFDPGLGQGRYCVELARRLASAHEVTIYANTFGVEREQGWRYARVPALRWNAISLVFSFLAASEARVRAGNHDVVHAQGLTCWRADVITAHMCNAARYRIAPPTRWRSRFFPALVNPVEARFYRQRQARMLIAVSHKVAAEVRESYGWQRPAAVIHHGVDSDQFRPAAGTEERLACRRRFGLPDQGRVWLFVGEANKGVHEVLGCLPDFPRDRLLVISRSDRREYEARASELGVADRLTFWGPEADVAPAYRAADVFVYPSNYDTFGMVVSEAMASGLPVIVGSGAGASELIEPGRNGFVVTPGQPEAVRMALRDLETVPGLGPDFGRRARETARAQSWDENARRTEELYRELARARGG